MTRKNRGERLLTAGIAIAIALATTPVRAQSALADLKLEPGDLVYVTESNGVEVSGRLTSMAATSLAIDGYRFALADIARIERSGDALWNGLLVGLAAGAAQAGLNIGLGDCLAVECDPWPSALAPVAVYGALGVFIDWRHKGRTRVFEGPASATRAVRVMPAIAPGRTVIRLAISF